ncbi:MAG: hypothetical protein N3G75_03135 [Methanothrix sp.]|nr:hypothetical protein [Methanothrix sp.]MCX8206808.1 hypothetical protein [Methanothrix sp.]
MVQIKQVDFSTKRMSKAEGTDADPPLRPNRPAHMGMILKYGEGI